MAVRIVLKRSSIPNKRPNADILSPGELALNTNSLTPGLFFETEDNSVVKVGPTAVGEEYPTLTPSLGETYYDIVNNSLSIGAIDPETASQVWKEISAPYLGGTNGYVVFVAPEFPTSTDSLLNDGQSAPYKSLNRAVIEVAKKSIALENEPDRLNNNRFTIFVQPGQNVVYNSPGKPLASTEDVTDIFGVNFDQNPDVSPSVLSEFNPVTGGLLIPRGTSVQGVDLRKTILTPSYVPKYNVPEVGYVNQPISSILKWTGNSYVTELTFKDKTILSLVQQFQEYKDTKSCEFVSLKPHGLALNDKVFFEFAPGATQTPIDPNENAVLSGYYYAYPVSVNSFLLSFTPVVAGEPNYVERGQLPVNNQGIAYICSVAWDPYSHHRLRCLGNATLTELNEFYTKVQAAFPTYFQGQRNQAEVINPGETEIVAPVPNAPFSLEANTNQNGSPYAFNVSVRSSYGLCGAENDGRLVTGFQSALVSQFTVASIQNDPYVYEVYTTIFDEATQSSVTAWYPLAVATWASVDNSQRPTNPWLVPRAAMLEYLNRIPVINIRYAYKSQTSAEGKTYGLPDLENDFRHFGVRCVNGGYIQVDTGWTVGTAIGFWSLNGSRLSVTNSTSNFGSVAIRTEGFAGIGTLGGALPQDQGFRFGGIRMPLKLTQYGVANYNIYSLGVGVKTVETDLATQVQTVTLGQGFEPITLLPFSLAPGTAIWIRSSVLEFRGFFVDDGLPTAVFLPNGDCRLRLRAEDSTIPNTVDPKVTANWDPPFIKRFQDPRTVMEQSYALILDNTSPGHRDPITGSILRLQQTSNNTNQALTVRPGVQFDPGSTGGWGRVFQVAFSQTTSDGDAPQYNETLLNRPTSSSYYTAILAVDNSRPWTDVYDRPHGAYVTFQNRNWYATCNDEWQGVYFSTSLEVQSRKKLLPTSYESPYANTYCIENQYPVAETFQGQYGGDPLAKDYEKETYFRGATPIRSNYDFSDYYNGDNGTANFGMLRADVSSGLATQTVQPFEPSDTVLYLQSVAQISSLANPKKTFVVLGLTDDNSPGRIEYVQVIEWDLFDNSAKVIRGVYGTVQDSAWPVGSRAELQKENTEVNPLDYDLDWAPTKYAMIRLLQVMGYTDVDIQTMLGPRPPSDRNLPLANISLQPSKGYALTTGPWNFEFNQPSALTCAFHQFHSVGYFTYSRGLPKYLQSNLNTKQYYDFVSTSIWGGYLTLFGQNEVGDTIVEGELKQAQTGRPYGSLSSDITNFPRYKVDRREDEDEQTYVRVVDTGVGLAGGPITDIGTISLIPATAGSLGGIIAGDGTAITPSGVLSIDKSQVGTVRSITAGIGLGCPNTGDSITLTGVMDLLPATNTVIGGITPGIGLALDTTAPGQLNLIPPANGNIGGVKAGTAISISADGAVSVLPPTATTIGGVKAGPGIVIAPDGTISLADGPSGVLRIDTLTFNGSTTDFSLTVAGVPFTPENAAYLMIVVGGVTQPTPDAYTVSGSTISFNTPPPAGASFYGIAFL